MALDPKVKLLCSFGGKILPRPGDSALRYAGGHTRILSLRRSATLADLLAKIGQIVAGPVTVKYQLPDEELDALISITTDEDLDNMMEEFDRIADAAGPDGSARMRIFLFSQADVDSSGEAAAGTDTGQIYVDAINGIGLLPRRDSLVSASSNEGMSPSTMSPSNGSNTQDPARSGLGLLRDETLAPTSSRVVEPLPLPQQQQAKDFNPPQNAVNVVNMAVAHQFAYPIYSGNAALMIPVAGNFGPKLEHLVVAGDNVNAIEGNLGPNQGKVEAFVEESLYRSDQSSNNETVSSGNGNVNGNGGNKDISQQPLSQLPPLHPTHFQQPQGAYIPSLMPCPQLALRLDDCQMCQRALLHAHSDTVITNSHANGNGNGSGSNAIHEVRPVLQSCHSEDPKRLQASLRPESAAVEPKVESAAVVPGQFSCQSENERAFHPNVEALDHVKVLHPNGVTGVADLSTLHAPPRIVNGVMVDSEAKVETLPTGGQSAASGFTEEIMHPHDKERLLLHPNIEAFDHAKVLHPHNAVSGALADNVMESMVDNMAASAQFASYGFTQIPRMLQPHDNDRLLVRSNMPSVVGLPVDLQTSYAMVANPSQCYLPDPFQPLLQNTAPPCHLAKQDMATRQNVSVVKNGNYHATEPPNRVSVPEIPYDFARPINGTMESLCGSTFGPLGTTEHQIAAAAVNGGLPMLKLENSTLLLENNHVVRPHVGGNMVFLANSHFMSGVVSKENYTKPIHKPPPPSTDMVPEHPAVSADNAQVFRSQAGVNALCLGNAFIASRIVPEGNSIRPIHEAPPSLEFSRLQSLQPSETSKASNMTANQGSLISYNQEVRIQPEVPNERLLVMPTYSCGTTAAYTNMNAINVVPIGGQKDEASWFRSNDTVDNAAVSLNSTAPVHCSKFGSSNVHIEQFQGPTPLNSLFCNQDPQKIMGSVQMVPPRMNKVPSKEFVAPKDASTENHLVNIKGSDVAVHAEESGFHHMQNSTNKEPRTGPVQFIQGEDHSKQEVQGSAEQVAAPVLQPSIPPAPVTFPRERTAADLPSSKESGFGETIAVVQSTAAIADHKTEGVTAKQAVNTNFGFPIKDDIGRLQIIKNSDLEELRELGSGTFGTVYHGKWRGSDVAIKRINNRCFAGELSEQPMRDDFWNEARKLADMHHPNVVAFYGVVLDGPGGTVATVTEFMVNGSLRRALQKNDKSLDRRRRLLIAMDVAFGMEYLHGKNIIHFDLKSDNLLVNLRDPQRPICKVADLGLSKVKCQTLISGGVRGTLPWMAPELLNGDNTLVSDKVDVFSFGIVMWELLTGEEPYADLHYGAIIGGIVSNTLRPPVPESCDPEWRSLMEHCWSPEPSERPNFTEIASRLRSMAASYPQK